MITLNQAAVLALALHRELPNALDHHIADAVETVDQLFIDGHREAEIDYDFDLAVDRGCDFVQDAMEREKNETALDELLCQLKGRVDLADKLRELLA